MASEWNYCVRCGARLELRPVAGEHQARLVCSNAACGRVSYRNAKPCAGALVEQDGRVLLVQRAIEPYRGAWDIPGGFLEEWEHPATAAIREVREETGLEIVLTALLGIFIDHYGPADYNTLNVYYRARVLGGVLQAADDAAALAWFVPDALPDAIAFPAHERQALAAWREALAREPQPHPLPFMTAWVAPGVVPRDPAAWEAAGDSSR